MEKELYENIKFWLPYDVCLEIEWFEVMCNISFVFGTNEINVFYMKFPLKSVITKKQKYLKSVAKINKTLIKTISLSIYTHS